MALARLISDTASEEDDRLDRVFHALSNRTRRAMLAHLSVLANLVTGALGPVVALVIYLAYKDLTEARGEPPVVQHPQIRR